MKTLLLRSSRFAFYLCLSALACSLGHFTAAVAQERPRSSVLSAESQVNLANRTPADFMVWRSETGYFYSLSLAGVSSAQQWGESTDLPVTGDFDGDGIKDIAVWRPSTGYWYIIQSSNKQIVARQWGAPTDVPVVGDFDGDGKADLAVWRPSTGYWYILQSSNGQIVTHQWGVSTDVPLVGDFDGDGKTDIAVWRPSTGYWYITQSSNNATVATPWGASTDMPIAGDFDGDGKTDIAVWRPSTGYWYAIQSSNGAVTAKQWGQAGDIPVPGDYDGDRKSDLAVWRPSTGFWYVIKSSNDSTIATEWGASSDIPANGSFEPATASPVPVGLSATAGNASVRLQWSSSSGAIGYSVQRATMNGGPYVQIGLPSISSYNDTTATNGTTYYYVIAALDLAGTSAISAQVSASPSAPVTIPAAPTGLTATAGNATVSLKWVASNGATGYHVKRASIKGGPYTQIAAPASAAYSDTTVTNGNTYYYVVSALDSSGESANSAEVSAAPSAPVTIAKPPTGLSATVGSTVVNLKWTASAGAASYRVKRATTSGGPYAQIAAVTSASYSDTSVTTGNTYYYVVSAVDSAGESANSAQVSATPTAAVTGLHVSGNKILNDLNQAVALRGVDKSGAEYECLGGNLVFDGPSDANSVTVLQSWAINVVRLPVNEDCWLGINGVIVGGAAYQQAIVAYVNLLTAANIATIIDLQWNAPGTTLANQQVPMPDSDHAPAFWTSVANTFKSNSAVIFDLFNEPYPDNNQDTSAAWYCMKNGGTCSGVSFQVASMQSLVNAVRATGSTNIVMMPGIQYANTMDHWLANKPDDPTGNLVASWHSYANQICNNQNCWDSTVKPVLQSVPLIAGEIGESDCMDVYINPLMTYLDANGANYLGWGWDTYNCSSFPALISDYEGTPTGFGLGFRNHLLILDDRTPPGN